MAGRKRKYNFISYERPYGTDREPYIHISTKSGLMFFSSKFMTLNKLEGYKYVQLFIDEARQAVALRFHAKKLGHCYKIKSEQRFNYNGLINTKPFVRELIKKGWLNDSFKSWYFTPEVYRRGKAVYYVIELQQGRRQP